MRNLLIINVLIILAMASACGTGNEAPEAEKRPKQFNEFGHSRTDNYYWMNNKKDPIVMSYLKQENEYLKQNLSASTKKLNNKISSELKSRISDDFNSVPYYENGYWYYHRYEKDKDYEIHCRKHESLDSIEEIILDVNELAKNLDYCDVDGLSVSPNNKILSFGLDTVSRRRYELRFYNMADKRFNHEVIPNTAGEVVFANDSRTMFYVAKETTTLRESKVFRHVLGMDASQDKEIFYEEDPTFELSVEQSKDNKYVIINHSNSVTSEVRLVDSDSPYTDPVVFRKREKGLEYYVDHCNGLFYIRTNENAKNFCIMTCDSTSYDHNWKMLVPHDENVLIEDFEIFNDYLVMEEMRNGLTCFEVMDLKTKERHLINFEQEAYSASTLYNPEPGCEYFRFGYSSPTTPYSVIHYNLDKREKKVEKEDFVPNYNKELYDVKRLMVKSRDGKEIPTTLLYRKDINLKGNNPMLQYAYGSYGYSEDDCFSSNIFSLVDRGFIFALAHIRGGSEMGYSWYEDGKLLNKMNTFNDFADVSAYLISENYTSADKLFAQGGSAGGLLMGVMANMYPQYYKGIIADVPFVDVVTTMLDSSIPLTTGEYDEWGNPNDEKYYNYMLQYSPYDNVKAQDYPAMLVTTGLHDSQVQYWEPAKWVAKLREYKTDNNPLYLYTNMKAGHSGDSGRFGQIKETAMEYSFILDLAGIKE